MSDDKKYNVWQLTDGTVVIQGGDIARKQLTAGRFRWIKTWSSVRRRLTTRARHEIYRVLERI